jgi:Kef-type K+ transport system membrane component KefB
MVATSVGNTARVLGDLGVLSTRTARIILGSAVFDEISAPSLSLLRRPLSPASGALAARIRLLLTVHSLVASMMAWGFCTHGPEFWR